MTDASKHVGVGRPRFLIEPQKQQIYDTALGILADIGMKVHHDEGEAVMIVGGCTRDDRGLVHVPSELVQKARQTAPARFMVYGCAGDPAMALGGHNSYYGNHSDLMHLFDLKNGERRLDTLDDGL